MKIVILGSCVTRDAFEYKSELLGSTHYFARSSLASVFSENIVSNVQLDKIASNFQKRMVQADLKKSLVNILKSNDFDLFIYDAIDERFDLLSDSRKKTLATLSNEIRATGYQTTKRLKIIPSGSNHFFSLWEKAWVKLVELFREKEALSKIRVNKVYWSLETENRDDFLPNYSEKQIKNANAFLERIYHRIAVDLPPQQFYSFPRYMLRGAHSHKWGKSPFHYTTAYYLQLMTKISNEISAAAETTQQSSARQALSLKNYFPASSTNELEVSFLNKSLKISTNIADGIRLYVKTTRVHINSLMKKDNTLNIAIYIGAHEQVTANATFYSVSGEKLFSKIFPVNQIKRIEVDKNTASVSVGLRIIGTQSFLLEDCLIGTEEYIKESRKLSK